MAMEGVVRSSISIIAAALLCLTLLVLAAANCGDGDGNGAAAAAAAVEKEKQCYRPLAPDELYALLAFQNNAGEVIRLLADQRSSDLLSGVSAFANRSGHWFYSGIQEEGGIRRCRLVPLHTRSRAEGFWNTLGMLVNTDDSKELARYVLVGMQTSGGDKIRLVVVADQRDFYITGYAKGWFLPPNWSFRHGETHRLVPTLGVNGGSHAEVVASNVLAALMNNKLTTYG